MKTCRMKHRLLYAFFLLTLPVLNAQIYGGTIGESRVYLQIESIDADGAVYGNYFYVSKCLNIPFEGSLRGDHLGLSAGSRFREVNDKEAFRLIRKDSLLSGVWKYRGKQLEVELTEVDPKTIPDYFTSREVAEKPPFPDFERIRLSFMDWALLDSTQMTDTGFQVQFYRERHSGIVLFDVYRADLPYPTGPWMNEQLMYQWFVAFSNYGTCGFGAEDNADGYHTTIRNYYVDSNFLSVSYTEDYYCGGAHPDFNSKILTLDLKNRKVLETEDIVQFDGYFEHNGHNEDDWMIYREENYAVRLIDYLDSLYPEYFHPLGDDPDAPECDYTDPSVWAFSEAEITPQGLRVGAYFARYARNCDDPEWAIIPYSVLAGSLNPAYEEALLDIERRNPLPSQH